MISPSNGDRRLGTECFQNPLKHKEQVNNLRGSDKFRTQHSDINELDEDEGCDYIDEEDTYDDVGLENLGAADEEEMSLGNFYTDLEKQPIINKYTTLSQREERENATPLKPTASCSNKTGKVSSFSKPKNPNGAAVSTSSNVVMHQTPSQG